MKLVQRKNECCNYYYYYYYLGNFPVYPELPSSPLMLGPIVQQTSPGENVWPSLPHLMMAAQHVPVLTSLSQPTHHRLHQHLQQQRHHLDHLGHFSYSSLSLPELPGNENLNMKKLPLLIHIKLLNSTRHL